MTMRCQKCWNPLSSGQEAAWRDDLVHIVCLDCLVDVCRRGELREIDRVDISVVAFLRLYDGQGANREGPASGVITDHQGSPVRVQRKRTKGWRMPENTVYVGRGSPFGNPYVVRRNVHTPMAAVAKFREYLDGDPGLVERAKMTLWGKNLACWCPLDQPCHADILLEVSNEPS